MVKLDSDRLCAEQDLTVGDLLQVDMVELQDLGCYRSSNSR